MSVLLNSETWATNIFGECEFGDARLTKRMEKIGTQLSQTIGSSLSASCDGNEAALEGSYRFIRNNRVTAEKIAEGGYKATIKACKGRRTLLAIEDTTSMSFSHEVKEQLGDICSHKEAYHKGFLIHSSLIIDGEKEATIGLIEQHRWCREGATFGKKRQRDTRAYQDKESYKWEENAKAIALRLGKLMSRVITVCDREADVYEYLQYKMHNSQRFIIRAQHDRALHKETGLLFSQISNLTVLGKYKVKIAQKGGRAARTATIELKSKQITVCPPKRKTNSDLKALTFNIVFATETGCPKEAEPLQWTLLTTEKVDHFADARQITRYYEQRWRIEEFHKAWKTGAGAERQRMQNAEPLEKMIVILGFIAVRLLQLKEGFEKEHFAPAEAEKTPCTTVLLQDEWKVLWLSVEKEKKLPKKIPSLGWAYLAIARLGGWTDTKRTGRASWATIWKGWFRLQERNEGYIIFKKKI